VDKLRLRLAGRAREGSRRLSAVARPVRCSGESGEGGSAKVDFTPRRSASSESRPTHPAIKLASLAFWRAERPQADRISLRSTRVSTSPVTFRSHGSSSSTRATDGNVIVCALNAAPRGLWPTTPPLTCVDASVGGAGRGLPGSPRRRLPRDPCFWRRGRTGETRRQDPPSASTQVNSGI